MAWLNAAGMNRAHAQFVDAIPLNIEEVVLAIELDGCTIRDGRGAQRIKAAWIFVVHTHWLQARMLLWDNTEHVPVDALKPVNHRQHARHRAIVVVLNWRLPAFGNTLFGK